MRNKSVGLTGYAFSLIIDQLIAILITLILTNIIGVFLGVIPVLQFIIGFSIYFFICYIDAWGRGSSDANRVRIGVLKKNNLRGIYAGLIAATPGFILAFLAFLAEINAIAIYDTFGVDIMTTLNRLWHLPISPLYNYVKSLPALNLLIPIFVPVVSEFGYLMGLKEYSLKQIFVYKNSDNNE